MKIFLDTECGDDRKDALFKSIGVQKRENRRDFHQVSDDLTLTQAANILNRHIAVADNR